MKKIITAVSFLFIIGTVSAQDPTFTQFYSNPLYLNPALAGSNNCGRIASNYRNEWPQLTGNYITYSASYDQYFKNISGGFGILATHDQQGQGTIKTTMLGLI
jgi:type IX secretion system PorP/SprF family membrane protein